MTLSKKTKSRIISLLIRNNLMEMKGEIVKGWTNTTHISDLTQDQASEMIDYLHDLADQGQRMRRKLLALGYEMFYDVPRNNHQALKNPKQVNFENVSKFCESKYSKYPKPLGKLNPFELRDIVTQFQQMARAFSKQL